MAEVADLWVTLRAITAPFTESLAMSAAGADEFIAQLEALNVAADEAAASLGRIGAGGALGDTEAAASLERLTVAADEAAAAIDRLAVAQARSTTSSREAAAASDELGGKWLGMSGVVKGASDFAALGVAGIGYEAVKMATDFQSSTTRLVTSAGEQQSALAQVRQGMLDMAGQVGVKADDLSKAMYYVEAAGYHAADGLTVLKAAAQGAAAEGADTTTVAQALTDVLTDYHLKASDAADITSKMIAAVSRGKTNLQDFSASFASIVPAASAAGISFQDVMAALANMTNHGFTAQRASQNLAQALRSLLNPTNKMYDAFQQYGVSSDVLKAKLAGPNGLTDAMEYIAQAATKAGPEGTSGFAAALKDMMGTAPGANAALSTVGNNFQATADTIKAVGSATADSSGKVQGFAEVQQTLGQQLKQLRAGFDSVMIRLGDFMIPKLSEFITLIESKGSPVVHDFASAISGIAAGFDGQAQKRTPGRVATTAGGAQHGGATTGAQPLTGWQEVGAELKTVADDLSTFGREAAKAFRDLAQAAGPTLQLLGGAGLTALRTIASILSGVVGPAVVAVSKFMDQHKTIVRDLITVALVPLAIRLAALSVLKPVGVIASLAKDIVTFPFSQAKQIWTGIQSGYQTVSTAAGTVKDGLTTAASKGMSAWQTVSSGASSTWDFVTSKASAGKDSLISSFNSARFRAAYMWQGLKDGGSNALTTLKSVGSSALTMGSNLAQAARAGAASAWSGMVSGLQSVATVGKAAAASLLETAVAAGQSALAATRAAIAWIAEKAATLASAVAEGVLTAAEWLLNVALDANPIGLVIIAIMALVAIVIYAWNHVTWFRVGVEVAFKAIETAALWLWHNVFEPAGRGIVAALSVVGSFFSNLPGEITSVFNGAERWLVDAGSKIIHGLVHGIESSISSVKNSLTNLTSELTSWKGPPEKDAVLLQPAGQLLIGGLINGIENKIPTLRSQLTGLTTEIGSMQPAFGPAVANAGALAVAGSAGLGALAVGQSPAAATAAGELPPIIVQVDGRQLFKILQTQALQNGKRNQTTGLVLA
ncbi:phage tail tape measure protein [Kitasatospora sp. RB6PN24]|uniref:phage tail tape measure protein n=1 Tax=Kitasatospora humi TaxID=2893891 RepID=UPI001E4B64A3|nr:phage tail tape measure protein [Kitasatospora humi]MCC9307678.1 phage tail tape measure protein [Kitasatospora humi]